jgi:GxxExxY protein
MGQGQLKSIALRVKRLGEEVRRHLGCGFNEAIYQNALAIEFRRNRIEYLKEVNIEIFYKDESVGVDRPDFLVTKIGAHAKPVLLELKVADKISDNHRLQLKSYCTSLPRNNNPVLHDFDGGILMSFPACDIDGCSRVKVFVVDPGFHVLIDDQEEEDLVCAREREKEKEKRRAR